MKLEIIIDSVDIEINYIKDALDKLLLKYPGMEISINDTMKFMRSADTSYIIVISASIVSAFTAVITAISSIVNSKNSRKIIIQLSSERRVEMPVDIEAEKLEEIIKVIKDNLESRSDIMQ